MRKNRVLFNFLLLIALAQTFSCHISHDKEIICSSNLEKARLLMFKMPIDTLSLDSALILLNHSIQCDSIKTAVIDLKVSLLITLGKFKSGSEFVDSLTETDFVFPYKKQLYHDNFIALNYQADKDTSKRNLIYQQMVSNLTRYINENKSNPNELEDAFLDLYTIKRIFVDSLTINREIDSLKNIYPNNKNLFDFLKD